MPEDKNKVKICDVTLRDGLQALDQKAELPMELRVRLFDALKRAGLPYIEVGSFVNARVMPSMEVTPELLGEIEPGAVETAVLVPKLKYLEKLLDSGVAKKVKTVALLASASEAYSRLNTRMSTDDTLAAVREVTRTALAEGLNVRAYLSYAFRDFGDQNEPQSPVPVIRLTSELLAAGSEMVAISDTSGNATPSDIRRIFGSLARTTGVDRLAAHLHDRYGLGITNAHIAYQEGVRIFDSAIGGIGGNKIVKGSVSNISTEELAYMFHATGVPTGLDFDALLEAGHLVEEMIGRLGAPTSQSKILLNRIEGLPAGM